MKLTKRISAIVVAFVLTAFAALSFAGAASASNETATVGFKLDPKGSTFFKEADKSADLTIETDITTPDSSILPMKQANLQLPGDEVSFNPSSKMPVCADDKIGPGLVSIEVPEAIAACPNSIIGNGQAQFALAQSTALSRDGVIILFNGGKQSSGSLKGQPRVKLYAYSYDTGVGLYAEAALAKDGSLDFSIPQLTADSSVTSIDLNLPGVATDVYIVSKDQTVTLPAGQDPNYVRAKCSNGTYPFSAEFLLGTRDTLGMDSGPTTILNASTSYACTGAAGKAKFGGLKIKGPKKVKRGKNATFKVKVKNAGTANAKKVKVKASGKKVKGKTKVNVGNLKPGQTKTVKFKLKLKKKGKIKTTFKATGKGVKVKVGKTKVKVK